MNFNHQNIKTKLRYHPERVIFKKFRVPENLVRTYNKYISWKYKRNLFKYKEQIITIPLRFGNR